MRTRGAIKVDIERFKKRGRDTAGLEAEYILAEIETYEARKKTVESYLADPENAPWPIDQIKAQLKAIEKALADAKKRANPKKVK